MKPLAGLALTALLLGGCGSTLVGSEPSATELREMKERILELQRRAAANEAELARLRAQVAALESARGRSEPPAPSGATRPEPRQPVPDLGERDPVVIEYTDLEAEDLTPPVVRSAPPQRPAEGPAPTSTPTTGPIEAAPGTGESATSDPAVAMTPAAQALYDRGYTLYHQGRYVDAESTFQRFLQSYPGTGLADNAQYWIGEARFARGDVSGALAAFRETVERFPSGNKVADAMLKAGDCLAQLGDVEAARRQYDAVGRRFPSSAASAMAEERRAKLP